MAYNNSHSVMLGHISTYLDQCCRKAYEQGRADERKEWELAAGELLVKYAGDIYEALPDMVEKIQTKAYEKGRAYEQDRILSIVSRCIAHNVYNVSEGIALLNEIKGDMNR